MKRLGILSLATLGSWLVLAVPASYFLDGPPAFITLTAALLCLIPAGIDDVSAAGIPVAYLTAQMTLSLAGFRAG